MTGNDPSHPLEPLDDLVRRLGHALRGQGRMLATAESCTGGLIADTLTNVPGSSGWFAGAVVAYADAIKQDLLGVPGAVLAGHGAVSRETVLAMAQGLRRLLRVDAAVAVSGIAGPTGGTPDKPVGTVWMAWSVGQACRAEGFAFPGSRLEVKAATARAALAGLLDMVQAAPGERD